MALTFKDKLLRIEMGIYASYNTDGYMNSIYEIAGDPIDMDYWRRLVGIDYYTELKDKSLTITLTLHL